VSDYIVRGLAANDTIRMFAATTRDLVQHAREVHHTSPVASAALGRMLTASAMMGVMLKGEKDLLTLQIRGTGPLQGVLATADSKGNVKGYVFQPNVEVPDKCKGKLNVSEAIGAGFLTVTRDVGLKEPYAGQIELVSGEIAEDLTYYFTQSEQTPSAIALGVLVDTDTSIKQSGGFIIQLLPDAPEENIIQLEENLGKLPAITTLLEEGKTPEDILKIVFEGMDLQITERVPTQFYCNCTRERVEKALISIGEVELEKMIHEDKKANLHCHFCGKEYDFDEQDLNTLLNNAK